MKPRKGHRRAGESQEGGTGGQVKPGKGAVGGGGRGEVPNVTHSGHS